MNSDQISSYAQDKQHLFTLERTPYDDQSLAKLPKDVLEALEDGDVELALMLLSQKNEGKVPSRFKRLQKLALLGIPLQKLMARRKQRSKVVKQSSWEGVSNGASKSKVKVTANPNRVIGMFHFLRQQAISKAALLLQAFGQAARLVKQTANFGRKIISRAFLLGATVFTPVLNAFSNFTERSQNWFQAQTDRGNKAKERISQIIGGFVDRVNQQIDSQKEGVQNWFNQNISDPFREQVDRGKEFINRGIQSLQKSAEDLLSKAHLAVIVPFMQRVSPIGNGIIHWIHWTAEATRNQAGRFFGKMKGKTGGQRAFVAKILYRGVGSFIFLVSDKTALFLDWIFEILRKLSSWVFGQLLLLVAFFKRTGQIAWFVVKMIALILWTVLKAFGSAIQWGAQRGLDRLRS